MLFITGLIFGFCFSLFCIAPEARKESRRCTRSTSEAKLVRWTASSIAESPPPTTTRRLFRKIGRAPSQTAHAEMPRCQNFSSFSTPRRRAIAPVATISVLVLKVSPPSVVTANGREERSTEAMVSVMMRAPQRSAWSRIRDIRSMPPIPSGNPGKFSISVVVVSCPPAAIPPAMNPSNIRGSSRARAA